jgi:hypothetical protein
MEVPYVATLKNQKNVIFFFFFSYTKWEQEGKTGPVWG